MDFSLPSPLKNAYDWGKASQYLFIASDLALALFFFEGTARALAVAIPMLLFIGVSAFRWATAEGQPNKEAADLLRSTSATNPEHGALADRLDFARKKGSVIVAAAIIGSAAAVAFAAWNPVADYFRRQPPTDISLAPLEWYLPGRKEAGRPRPAFIDGLIIRMQRESQDAKKLPLPFYGHSRQLSHPTPAFNLELLCKDDGFELSVYAFRFHLRDGSPMFEPIEIAYRNSGSVLLEVPACETGDDILLVGRLAYSDPRKRLPTLPSDILDLSIQPQGASK